MPAGAGLGLQLVDQIEDDPDQRQPLARRLALVAQQRQGERARMAAPEIFSGEAADLSRRLRQAGFLALAKVFSPVGLHTGEDMAAFCLRAAYAVRTTRSARARLAWMR